jgi:hypothetical protein
VRSITHRRLCGVLGAGLLALVAAGIVLVGAALLSSPTTAVQVVLIGAAGALDVVAAFENPITTRLDWFRLSGVANVALGLALPVGILGWGNGAGGAFLFAVTAAGGLALAAMGADIALYAGAHIYERRLDAPEDDGDGAAVE